MVGVRQFETDPEGRARRVHNLVHDRDPCAERPTRWTGWSDLGHRPDLDLSQHRQRREHFDPERVDLGQLENRLLFHQFTGMLQSFHDHASDRTPDGPLHESGLRVTQFQLRERQPQHTTGAGRLLFPVTADKETGS